MGNVQKHQDSSTISQAHAPDHAHAGPKEYWIFAAILCVITFLEWAIFHYKEPWGVSNTVLIWSLIAMSVVKFVMVVGWYMHLRFDHKILTKIFVFSMFLAVGVFAILKFSLPR